MSTRPVPPAPPPPDGHRRCRQIVAGMLSAMHHCERFLAEHPRRCRCELCRPADPYAFDGDDLRAEVGFLWESLQRLHSCLDGEVSRIGGRVPVAENCPIQSPLPTAAS